MLAEVSMWRMAAEDSRLRLTKQRGERLAFVSDGERAFAGAVEHLIKWDAEGVSDGGVELGDGDGVCLRFVTDFVGRAIDLTAPDAAACHEAGKA